MATIPLSTRGQGNENEAGEEDDPVTMRYKD